MADIDLAKGDGWWGREIDVTDSPQTIDLGRHVPYFKLIHKTGDEVFISQDAEVLADADKYPYLLADESYIYENRDPSEEVRQVALVCSSGETATVRLEL